MVVAAAVAIAPGVLHAAAVHRWSFNTAAGAAPAGTTFVDAISAAPAVVRGQGAALNGSSLVLPGTTNGNQNDATISAYLDLPNGILSSKTNLTIEVWAQALSSKNNQRLLAFGRNTTGDPTGAPGEWTGTAGNGPTSNQSVDQELHLALQTSGSFGTQRLRLRRDGDNDDVTSGHSPSTTVMYHYVVTFTDGAGTFGAAGGLAAWYRNGTLIGSVSVNHKLAALADVNNWIGRSLSTGNSNANIAVDELRIFDHAFTQSEVSASFATGPNPPAPGVVADFATMHRNGKALLPVLANDMGSPDPDSVTIVTPPQFGTAVPDAAGRVLYAHTTGTPAQDQFTYRVFNATGSAFADATATISFTDALRFTPLVHNVPNTPPATSYAVVPAFPGLSVPTPVSMATAPGDTQRLFVCDWTGRVRVIPDVTSSTPTLGTVIDLPQMLANRGQGEVFSTEGDNGLVGLAFHPNYANNGYFYVFYAVQRSGLDYQRIARLTVPANQRTQPVPLADPLSELIFLEQRDENNEHNAGDMHFGPDGYLYVAMGDEGCCTDIYDNAQRIDGDIYSAVLRLDVDKKPGSLEPNAHPAVPRDNGIARYSIPPDNPFVGATSFNGQAVNPANVRTEFFAVGFRSNWRFSIDMPTGEIWLGDVGEDTWEEVNVVVSGGNYGWSYREGAHPGPKAAQTPPGFTSIDPVHEYTHGSGPFEGNSVTGGIVYRGSRISALVGAYVFSDWVVPNVWALRRDGGQVQIERIAGQDRIADYAADPSNGDVLMANLYNNQILRLVAVTTPGSFPATLSETGLFADLTDLAPNPGLLPYEPNLPFWSDHAIKRRWFRLPNATDTMTWSRDENWTFPTGTIWVKHFDLELERGNPASRKRIETRLLYKTADGVFGVSYQWNEAETEATLVPDEGASFDLNITDNGSPVVQTWQIPSRNACLSCHTPQAGYALSFTTRQLNLDSTIAGIPGNLLTVLDDGGCFANPPDDPVTLPRHARPDETQFPLEARVRSFLAVNCAQCHRGPDGSAPPSWDARAHLTLAGTGVINGEAGANLGDPTNKLIVPGDLLHSIIYNRVGASNGFSRMPPLATNERDQTSINLLAAWIAELGAAPRLYDDWRTANFVPPENPAGDPSADPDGDGRTNDAEFTGGTAPLDAGSFLQPAVDVTGGTATLTFDLPANRSFRVETSFDLQTWTRWDVPGNEGQPWIGGTVVISGPVAGNAQFFRVHITEN